MRGGVAAVLAICGTVGLAVLRAAAPGAAMSGTWRLNQDLSQLPAIIGFGFGAAEDEHGGGGRSGDEGAEAGGRAERRGGASGGSTQALLVAPHFESEEESLEIRELADAAEHPPAALTLTVVDGKVTIDDARHPLTVRTDDKERDLELTAGPIGVAARWDHDQLVVRYLLDRDREVRYRYSRDAAGRLIVETQFAEDGRGTSVRRVYDPAVR